MFNVITKYNKGGQTMDENIPKEPKAPNAQLPDDLKAALSFLQKRGLQMTDEIQPELEEEEEPDENSDTSTNIDDDIESLESMQASSLIDVDDIKETDEEVNDLDDLF